MHVSFCVCLFNLIDVFIYREGCAQIILYVYVCLCEFVCVCVFEFIDVLIYGEGCA